MQALTTWEYYDGAFKAAMGEIKVPQAEFNRLAIKASAIVRAKTFGNIDESNQLATMYSFAYATWWKYCITAKSITVISQDLLTE